MGVENPDWLPAGWKVCVKIRSCGKKDKYYVNSSKGLKFNSKPEVLRYLKTSRKDRKPKNPNEVDIEKTVAEKLPPGWIKEIRVKKKGGKTRRDPYYIDPVSGRHFRSMPEVFRYLESKDLEKAESKPDDKDHSQSSSAKAKRQRSIDKKADKILTEHETVKSGPKLARNLEGATMNNVNVSKDNCLEQREEDDSLAIELSDKLQLVSGVEQFPGRTTETRKSVNNKADKSVDDDQRLESGSKVSYVERKEGEDDYVARNLPNKLPKVNGKERNEVGRRQSKRLADIKLKDNVIEDPSFKSGSEGDAVKNINTSEINGTEQRKEETNSIVEGESSKQKYPAHQNKREHSNGKRTSDLPRRTSKRLAQIEVDPSLEVKTSKKARPSDEPQIYPTEKFAKSNDPNELPTKCRTTNPTNSKQQKPVSLPLENISSLTEDRSDGTPYPTNNKQQKPVALPLENLSILKEDRSDGTTNPTNRKQQKPVALPLENLSTLEEDRSDGVDSKVDEKPEKHHLDSSLDDILMDPCIEFAIKTLTGAIPIEDLKKVDESPASSSRASPNQTSASSSILPCGDIWADPCFEFAVKTLTGDTPMDNLPKFRLDNFYTSNYSFSQFDAVKKPSVRQQGVRDPTLPINGSSKKFGLHQGVEGRNGNFV
ncbi:hypothetical protein BUALT_Bualt06G0113300 [Buddleja alternifolia]|uniref:MBD domain-containing protein n=1 Tax=Buddleja alternifolia TaxID=168488 RepID=A0AAV6XEI7_9LAMI|nr:hypothetical protein BUALT_Bualt06G0113300 [Buddleja alternifolia]